MTGFDVKLNDKQDAVDVSITIDEGEPVLVAAVEFVGFDVIPADHLEAMQNRLPLEGRSSRATASWSSPRTRWRSTSCAITAIRMHEVASTSTTGRRQGRSTLTFTAEPGPLAHFGPVEISGNQASAIA